MTDSVARIALMIALTIGLASTGSTVQAQPTFQLPVLGSQENLSLSELQGKVVYVDFWASWCTPCLQSFPALDRLYQRYKQQGLQVVAINLDENLTDAKAFLQRNPVSFPILVDREKTSPQAFKVAAMPTGFLLDQSGTVQWVHKGFKSGDEARLASQIEQLLQESSQ